MNALLDTAGRWVRRNVEFGTLLILALAVAGVAFLHTASIARNDVATNGYAL